MSKEYPELLLTPFLARQSGVESGELCRVAAGNQTVLAFADVSDGASDNTITVTPELSFSLGIPDGVDVNIRYDGDRFHIGPVVGILTESYHKQKGSFGSQNTFFHGLLTSLRQLNGIGYVFTPQDINWRSKTIHGYHRGPGDKSSWRRRWFPFPDVCYNRYFRSAHSFRTQSSIPSPKFKQQVKIFNLPIGNKWNIHQQLNAVPGLKAHLPETRLLSSSRILNLMLAKYREVYVKPVNGSKGQGIAKIVRKNGGYRLKTSSSSKLLEYDSLPEVFRLVRHLAPGQSLMIQQSIPVKGTPLFDFRVLIQRDRLSQWSVTGIAARIGSASGITTNLHTGGHAVSLNQVLSRRGFAAHQILSIQQEMEHLAAQIARVIARNDPLIGELGLDFIVDSRGKVWFLEANPKPARHSFTQISKDLRSLTVFRPMEYACYLSGF